MRTIFLPIRITRKIRTACKTLYNCEKPTPDDLFTFCESAYELGIEQVLDVARTTLRERANRLKLVSATKTTEVTHGSNHSVTSSKGCETRRQVKACPNEGDKQREAFRHS